MGFVGDSLANGRLKRLTVASRTCTAAMRARAGPNDCLMPRSVSTPAGGHRQQALQSGSHVEDLTAMLGGLVTTSRDFQ